MWFWEAGISDIALADGILTDDAKGLLDEYRSRPKQLARWLLISRDQLREKYQAVKIETKRLKVRVADVAKSRDMWQQRAVVCQQQLIAMQAEVERLSALVEQTSKKVNAS